VKAKRSTLDRILRSKDGKEFIEKMVTRGIGELIDFNVFRECFLRIVEERIWMLENETHLIKPSQRRRTK
jgi:hypothetical protein